MKISTLVLTASLVVNAGLAAVFLSPQPATSRQAPASRASTQQLRGTPASASSTGADPFGSMPVRPAASGGRPLWQQLHTDDPQALTARLKAAGFPGATAYAIAMALHYEKLSAARLAITGEPENVSYWKVKNYTRPTPEQQARLDEISKAQFETFFAGYMDPEVLAELSVVNSGFLRRFGNLAPEKLQQLLRIEYDYGRMQSELRPSGPSLRSVDKPSPEELATREKLALLEKEKIADFRAALTPEEFAEFEHRSSPTASRLQQQVSLFRPTEDEYKALFALYQPVDQRLGLDMTHISSSPETEKARAEALKQLAPQIEAALGPDRYADYVQATSGTAQQLNRLLVRLDLPLRTATQIESVRNEMKIRGQELGVTAKNLPRDQQIALAQALVNEAKQKLTSLLGGERGYNAYVETAGSWLREVPSR